MCFSLSVLHEVGGSYLIVECFPPPCLPIHPLNLMEGGRPKDYTSICTHSHMKHSYSTVSFSLLPFSSSQDGGVGMGPTLARRPSRRAHFSSEAPPNYPGPPVGLSFNPQELSDSDEEEEDVFISAAPPDYRDVVQQPPA